MDKRLLELAYRFRGRCRSPQDWEDLQQDVYVIYLQHRHKYNPRKSSFRTWCYNYLFKKVLTYVESAPVRNQQRNVPTSPEDMPVLTTKQLSLDLRKKLKNLTDDDIYAINKYDPKLPHHRRGRFVKSIKRLRSRLEEL
jgi:DNA-directed RNA polymerase specialized sigma24 family protein